MRVEAAAVVGSCSSIQGKPTVDVPLPHDNINRRRSQTTTLIKRPYPGRKPRGQVTTEGKLEIRGDKVIRKTDSYSEGGAG